MERSYAAAVYNIMLKHVTVMFQMASLAYTKTIAAERLHRHFYNEIFDAYHLLSSDDDSSAASNSPLYAFYGVTSESGFQELQLDRLVAAGAALGFDLQPVQTLRHQRAFQLWHTEMTQLWHHLEAHRVEMSRLRQLMLAAHDQLVEMRRFGRAFDFE
jgi:hypothetical protein